MTGTVMHLISEGAPAARFFCEPVTEKLRIGELLMNEDPIIL